MFYLFCFVSVLPFFVSPFAARLFLVRVPVFSFSYFCFFFVSPTMEYKKYQNVSNFIKINQNSSFSKFINFQKRILDGF